jgi:hypothetical protein
VKKRESFCVKANAGKEVGRCKSEDWKGWTPVKKARKRKDYERKRKDGAQVSTFKN